MQKKDGRSENSGLIDLDALLRQATDSERDLAVAARASEEARLAPPSRLPAVVAAPAPVNAPLPPMSATPTPSSAVTIAPPRKTLLAAVRREPDESLAGMSTPTASAAAAVVAAADAQPTSSAKPNVVAAAAAPSARPRRSARRVTAALAAAAVLLCAAVVVHRASRSDSPAAAHEPIVPTAAAMTGAPAPTSRAAAAGIAPGALGPGDLPSLPAAPEPAAPVRGAAAPRARDPVAADPKGPHVTAVTLPDAPPRDPSDLGEAMRGAVGTRAQSDPSFAAQPSSSARQLRPSPGAVVGAINGVLSAARACLEADDPVRVAAITFRADGSVARVDIEGERATNGCVRSALTKARIDPFVDDTFVTRVTVRP